MSGPTDNYTTSLLPGGVLRFGGCIQRWTGTITIRSNDPEDYTFTTHNGRKPPKVAMEYLRKRRLVAIIEQEIMA